MKTFSMFLILFWTVIAHSDPSRWRYVGPDGAYAALLVSDPSHPGFVLVNTDAGVYRSNNGGDSWVQIFSPKSVYDIVIHPLTSRIYILAEKGLWISDDQARSFRQTASTSGDVSNLFTLDTNQDFLYGINTSSLYWSSDLGRHWTRIPIPTPGDAYWRLSGFAAAPFSNGTLYLSGTRIVEDWTAVNLLLASSNAGRSWSVVDRTRCGLSADPPDRVLAACTDGFSVITSRGLERRSKIELDLVRSVSEHPNEVFGLKYYAHPKGTPQIYYSSNLGKNWISVSGPGGDHIQTLIPLASPQPALLAGTFHLGVVRKQISTPWRQSNQGIEGQTFHEVYGPQGRVYANTGTYLWTRTQEEAEWRYSRQQDALHLAIDPGNPQRLFRSSYHSSFESTDGGKTWKSAGPYNSVTFSPSNPAIVYFTGDHSRFFKSTDGGATVERLPLLVSTDQILVDPGDPNTLYFLEYKRGILKSTDGGHTLSEVNAGLNPLTVRSFAHLGPRNSLLAIAYTNDVFRTDNAGISWHHISKIPGPSGSSASHLNPLPIYPADWNGDHFFVVSGNRLMETTNTGKTWADVSPVGSTRLSVHGMSDPRQHPIYVATNHGLYMH